MRYKLITCEIIYREICAATARSINQIDIEFLPKRLHDIGQQRMLQRLKEALDQVDESKYDAILLGYGLCNNGVVGLEAKSIPLVIPRAHDCITFFLGGKNQYNTYFHSHPGCFYLTSGWIERGTDSEGNELAIQNQCGMTQDYEALVKKYGEDNAKFLFEELCNMTRNYSQITFIEMGIEPDSRFENKAREEADKNGWKFEKIPGDMSLVQHLLDGEWDENSFLVIPPDHKIVAKYDDQIVDREKIK